VTILILEMIMHLSMSNLRRGWATSTHGHFDCEVFLLGRNFNCTLCLQGREFCTVAILKDQESHLMNHLSSCKYLGGGHGDLQYCGVDVFFTAVMWWIKSQLAVLRWSQTLQCVMFVFFTPQCSVKWNCSRCWAFLIYLSQPKFGLNLACKLH